jgi:flagellar biosynthesis protein FlhG
MRPEFATDQAEGLRRLLVRTSARIVTMAGGAPGAGGTSLVTNLAAALVRAGKDVLVLDENLSHNNVANTLGLKPRYDLLNAIWRDKSLQEVMLRAGQGLRVLPMARAMQALPQLSSLEYERLLECLATASLGIDAVLVDAAVGEGRHVSSSLIADQPLVVVLNATASSITEGYKLIKRMAMQEGRRNFWVVVNKVQDEGEAQTVFGNMAQVARRHLQVSVQYLGHVPLDDKLKRATQLDRPVVDVFPESRAARAFDELGRSLMMLRAAEDSGQGLSGMMQRLMRQVRSPNRVMAH